METSHYIGMAALMSGLLVLITAYAMFGPRPEPRDYTNPIVRESELEGSTKWIRPLLRNFIPESPLQRVLAGGRGSKIDELLIRSGNPLKLRATEYLALQLLLAAFGLVGALILVSFQLLPSQVPAPLIVLGFPAIGYIIPFSYHNSLREERARQIRRTLPEALDLLVITMNAGKAFDPALNSVVPRLPEGLLKDELALVDKDLQAGQPVKHALNKFARRASSSEAESFAKAVGQAQELGSDINETLVNQAAASRQAYEAAIDKKIASLSTKMMLPLIPTMLPALMAILLLPTTQSLSMAF